MPNLGQVLFTLGNMNNQAYQSQLQQQNLAANQQSLADNAMRMQAYQDQQGALGAYGKNFINALTAQTPQAMTAPMPTTPPPQPGQASVPMVQPTNVAGSKAPPSPTNGLAPVQPIAGAMQQAGNLAGAPTVAKGLSQAPSSAGQQGAPQPPQTLDALTGSILNADPTQPIPNPSLQLLSQTLNGPLKPVMDALQKAGQERPQDDPILHASMTAWQKYLSDNPNATPGQLAAFTSVALPQTMDLLKEYSAQTRIPLNSLLTFGGTLARAVQTANTAQLGNQVKIATTDQNNAMRQYVSDNSLKAAQLRSQAQVQAAQTRASGGIGLNVDPTKPLPNSAEEQTAQGIANGELPPISPYAMSRPSSQVIMARVMQLNPNYRAANYGAMSKFLGGQQLNTMRSIGVAISHLDTLSSLAADLKNGGAPAFNKFSNAIAQMTGSPAPTNFDAAKQTIAAEVVKAIAGTGQTALHDRQTAMEIFDRAKSPAQLAGAIKTVQQLLGGQIQGYVRQGEAVGVPEKTMKATVGDVAWNLLDATGKPKNSENPPAAGAKRGLDGKWYVQKGNEFYRVQ